jgi:hypothetical protein
MTLRKIENFDGEDCVLWFFFCILKFHGKIILNVIFLISFVGSVEMLQSFLNQNNTLLDYCIIYMCIDFTT